MTLAEQKRQDAAAARIRAQMDAAGVDVPYPQQIVNSVLGQGGGGMAGGSYYQNAMNQNIGGGMGQMYGGYGGATASFGGGQPGAGYNDAITR